MDLGGESMNLPRGWIEEAPGWWTKEDWRIKVKFKRQAERIFFSSTALAHPQLHKVVQYVTHVESTQNAKFGIEVLFDAWVPSKLYRLQRINMAVNSADVAALEKAISSGHLPWLKYLWFHRHAGHGLFTFPVDEIGDEAVKSLGVAIRSGGLKNLAELHLNQIGLTDEGLIALTDSLQEGVASLLPNLSFLDIGLNSFTTVAILSLAGALSSGKLPNLRSLNISKNDFIRNEGAKIIGLAIRSGNSKTLGVGISTEGLIATVDSFQQGIVSVLQMLSSGRLSSLIYLARCVSPLSCSYMSCARCCGRTDGDVKPVILLDKESSAALGLMFVYRWNEASSTNTIVSHLTRS